MRQLSKCQSSQIQIALQKIDRKSKPIKKHEKLITECLKRKKIHLDEENFDILTLLQRNTKKNGQVEFKTPTKTPNNTVNDTDFQFPTSILKSKPLKSDKDRRAALEKEH